jgi:hypothetical protein
VNRLSKEDYSKYLSERIAHLETKIRMARSKRATGSGHEKVEAAGSLAVLEKDRAAVRVKLERLQEEPDNIWEDAKATIEEEIDMLDSAIERLMAPR